MSPSPDAASATEPISLTRILDAPRERVWREWTEPDRFADWFGGTAGEIVFTLSTQPPPSARYALANVAFAELGEGRTEMRFERRGSLSPGQASVARYVWARSFDRLAERLAAA